MDSNWLQEHTARTQQRLLPRLKQHFSQAPSTKAADWDNFETRFLRHFPRLFKLLYQVYGDQYDFFYHLEQILISLANIWAERPADLKTLDAEREADPGWFQTGRQLGGICYVDLFAGDLQGIEAKIPYFQELGLTYLHLMPLFLAPEDDSDGGYAVSSYREVNPSLGTMAQLQHLAATLRAHGISLVVDFVFNHTSDEHEWAKRALAGEKLYQDYYWIFPDRTIPNQYQRTLRDIFPDRSSGSFSYRSEIDSYVWTTFNTFQWDLNYSNPEVFTRMMQEMLFLANVGVEILRLDAVAFIWKEMGTSCENRPKAHLLIQAFNAAARIATPSLLFKSEAIVHPDDVNAYISPEECQLSYNPLLMALLWESLATRKTNLLALSMNNRFAIDAQCSWANYVRCHDDIGWTFADEDAWQLNINGFDHRQFLNRFYTGRFEGSFARGLPFQENPLTGDARISGSLASLAGLEAALQANNPHEIELAIGRILLLHSVILSIGGIPLIYLGDEVGHLNDYRYQKDPDKMADNRWVNRPLIDWDKIAQRTDKAGIEGRIFTGLQRLIQVRQSNPAFNGSSMRVIQPHNDHLFGYIRQSNGQRMLVLANFSEHRQQVAANELRLYGLGYHFTDLVNDAPVNLEFDVGLGPYQFMWLVSTDPS